jgi:hypothetical protein
MRQKENYWRNTLDKEYLLASILTSPLGKTRYLNLCMISVCTGCVPPKHGKGTNHGGRRHGINMMAQAGVSTSENMAHARHTNANGNAMYQQTTEVTRSSRVLAQHSSGVTSTSSTMVNTCRPRGMGVIRMNYRRPILQDIVGSTTI